MFKKKQPPQKKRDVSSQQRKRSPMPAGVFDMYGMDEDMMGDGGDDDPNLEAELNQLLGEGGGKKRAPQQKPKKQLLDWGELDAQISASLQDDDEDEDLDLEDAGDLEAELEGIVSDEDDSLAPPSQNRGRSPSPHPEAASGGLVQLLEDRKTNYEAAIRNAEAKGDSTSKIRRYKRGFDTIVTMLKNAKAGKPVNQDDIPCQVATGAAKPTPVPADIPPTPAAPTVQVSPPKPALRPKPVMPEQLKEQIKVDSNLVEELKKRQHLFKTAAFAAKKSGNKDDALKMLRVIKQYDAAIKQVEEGKAIDLNQMPPPPAQQAPTAAQATTAAPPEKQPQTQIPPPTSTGIPTPKTLLEGLLQRRQKYQSTADQAKADGNGSKSRRMMRIVKQYDDAIKSCKAGKPFDVAELPVPMGYPPLPGSNEKQQDISDVLQQADNLQKDDAEMPQPRVAVAAHAAAAMQPAQRPSPSTNRLSQPKPARSPSPQSRGNSQNSAYQQQLDFLLNRQAAFKEAALAAKKKGDKDTAMDLLKKMKGFQPMIQQAQNGLKIDITKVPMAPMIRDEESSVTDDVAFEILDGGKYHEDDAEIYKTLLDKLHEQVKKARGYSEQFTHTGDVNGANKFDHLSRESQSDYDFVKSLKRHGDPPPRYYYETKTFESARIIPELNTTEMELVIVQLLDLVAKDAKPIVEWEMPFPNDSPMKGRTEEGRGSGHFKYDAHFRVTINRKNRGFQRAIKSKAIKIEVLQKGGFLRSDKTLGSTVIKLAPLETSCEIHAVEPLKEGRAVVGRLEVKVRMRTPLISSESKTMTEKWMIVSHEHVQRRARAPKPSAGRPAPSATQQRGSQRKDYKHPKIQGSLEVLSLEKRMVDAKIKDLRSKGELVPASVLQNQQHVQSRITITNKFLKEGGMEAKKHYAQYLKTEFENLTREAQMNVKQGKQDQAKFCLTKRKMIENERSKMAPSNTYL